MLATVDYIIHEQEAMRGQIEFLQRYTLKWKVASAQKETDQKALTQLILTTYYLKEGLEDLYNREDNFMLSNLKPATADEIIFKHATVMNSLDMIYRSLVGLTSKILLMNKEHVSDTINGLCQLISLQSVRENEILKSNTN